MVMPKPVPLTRQDLITIQDILATVAMCGYGPQANSLVPPPPHPIEAKRIAAMLMDRLR